MTTKLNNRQKIKILKIRVGRGIGSGKGKPLEEELKVKNQDQELQLKVLRVVRCHYIDVYQKEVLIQCHWKKLLF